MLASARDFAVLAGSTVTNTGPTRVSGDLGVWPGLAITGFPPGRVFNGSMRAGDGLAQQAQSDITQAYETLAAMPRTHTLTSVDMGGMTLQPGVYFFESSAALTGALTLDALGDTEARFVFQIGSTLTAAIDSSVRTINGANVNNVYWQVGSSATIGSNADFQGNILAMASITLNTGAAIAGGAYARVGAVTMQSNRVSNACIADFNGDRFVDFFDYDEFVACFETGSCTGRRSADINGDDFVDFFDYDAYVEAFEHGC
jgi:type VI secretion system secreted protein VgrG